jgi:hypothetical protein
MADPGADFRRVLGEMGLGRVVLNGE